MSLRFQRLLLIFLSLIFLTASIFLILFNSKKNLIFFYTPSELLNSKTQINDTIRIGGIVKKDSLKNIEDDKYVFIIQDNNNYVRVSYTGILPDLFREEQGVVVQGKLIKIDKIKADRVFAKHDENYMPTSIKKQLEKNKYWNKSYQ
jgi:cytochrome c-type biogenesis protein CcmE|tara:strand:- start:616 stop:1056 length:441 start_codon:yes stop_codon:yes gene_type:complete